MLRPRKLPLIDQPLIAALSSIFRRLRWTLRTVVLVALLAGGAWFWLVQNSGDEIYTDFWWRNALSDLVSRQFHENISEAKDSRMGERIKAFETERAEMQAKLQSLDKLVHVSKMDGWLRQFSAKRETDNEISYELLLSNPHPGQARPPAARPPRRISSCWCAASTASTSIPPKQASRNRPCASRPSNTNWARRASPRPCVAGSAPRRRAS
ncbi:MAG: hypothetical protein MO853_03970 [Candidatus Protistobacter heckmanni]|nr:hypothetical protein [Candidatus Protistobacter heckmanni]